MKEEMEMEKRRLQEEMERQCLQEMQKRSLSSLEQQIEEKFTQLRKKKEQAKLIAAQTESSDKQVKLQELEAELKRCLDEQKM